MQTYKPILTVPSYGSGAEQGVIKRGLPETLWEEGYKLALKIKQKKSPAPALCSG